MTDLRSTLPFALLIIDYILGEFPKWVLLILTKPLPSPGMVEDWTEIA